MLKEVKNMNMKDFSDYIIDVANRKNIAISNLQLQKVMFFTLRYALQNNIYTEDFVEQFYDEKFLVWRYGPTVESIYEKYLICGAEPLIESPKTTDYFNDTRIEDEIEKLLNTSIFKLVEISHTDNRWLFNEHFISGWRSNVEYSIDDLKNGDSV